MKLNYDLDYWDCNFYLTYFNKWAYAFFCPALTELKHSFWITFQILLRRFFLRVPPFTGAENTDPVLRVHHHTDSCHFYERVHEKQGHISNAPMRLRLKVTKTHMLQNTPINKRNFKAKDIVLTLVSCHVRQPD